jgi:hypothetical protein
MEVFKNRKIVAKVTYDQALADHKTLWSIDAASDMTGGYVDQNDLATLLKSPTKATARDCLESQICYWFSNGTEDGRTYSDLVGDYPELELIKERYGC